MDYQLNKCRVINKKIPKNFKKIVQSPSTPRTSPFPRNPSTRISCIKSSEQKKREFQKQQRVQLSKFITEMQIDTPILIAKNQRKIRDLEGQIIELRNINFKLLANWKVEYLTQLTTDYKYLAVLEKQIANLEARILVEQPQLLSNYQLQLGAGSAQKLYQAKIQILGEEIGQKNKRLVQLQIQNQQLKKQLFQNQINSQKVKTRIKAIAEMSKRIKELQLQVNKAINMLQFKEKRSVILHSLMGLFNQQSVVSLNLLQDQQSNV